MECKREAAQKMFPFWEHLLEKQQKQLLEHMMERTYKKGAYIFSGVDECIGIILVQKGRLRIYIESEDGRDITLFWLEKGDTCTLSSSCIMDEITFHVQIEAEEESSLYIIDTIYFNQLVNENIYVENFLYKQTTAKFSEIMWALQQILFLSFDQRLASFLQRECEKRQSDDICMTHEQLAKNIGSAREVVSRMLKYFEKEGIVTLSRGKIHICSHEKLEQLLEK